jgi:transposase
VIADRVFAADRVRHAIVARGAVPTIPPKANRRWKIRFRPTLCRSGNAIERMFCRLKDFRRIAPRYDRLAATCLGAVGIAATVAFWMAVRTLEPRVAGWPRQHGVYGSR